MEYLVSAAYALSVFQYFYMKNIFRKGKLTLPFLNDAANTISGYSDAYLPVHVSTLNILRHGFIPKVELFLKRETNFTYGIRLACLVNATVLLGVIGDLITAGWWYFAVGLLVAVNTDIIIQQWTLYTAKYKMKNICWRFTEYMRLREVSKDSMDSFIKNIDEIVDSIPFAEEEDTSDERNE